jgi:hypothetical protein
MYEKYISCLNVSGCSLYSVTKPVSSFFFVCSKNKTKTQFIRPAQEISALSISDNEEKAMGNKFQNTMILLVMVGVLALSRFLYDLYIVIAALKMDPLRNITAYLILVVTDGYCQWLTFQTYLKSRAS